VGTVPTGVSGTIRVRAVDLSGAFAEATTSFNVSALAPPTPPFALHPDGSLEPRCDGPVTVEVVAKEITYGAGGPDIPVQAWFTQDRGAQFEALFGGDPPTRGSTATYGGVPAGALIGIRGKAAYESFAAEYDSFTSDPHVSVLADGDPVPSVAAFDDQTQIDVYLRPYVNLETQTISLPHDHAIVLFEFNPRLDSEAADYQDLVVLFGFSDAGCAA
jgi:hypothetical protein